MDNEYWRSKVAERYHLIAIAAGRLPLGVITRSLQKYRRKRER